MISYEDFEDIVVNQLNRDISSNEDQKLSIKSSPEKTLFIVAGPGSGKTTVIVLKILKYIFVDDIKPEEILATTFTRKAADELKSRILSCGDEIKNYLINNSSPLEQFEIIKKVNRIDFNQLIIGTIDSISEELIRKYKELGTNLPILIENFVAKSAMLSEGLYKNDRYLNKDLISFLSIYSNRKELKEATHMSEILLEMKNRMYYDQVDINELYEKKGEKGEKIALDAICDYENELRNRNIMDFPMLEASFLKKLSNNKLDQFLDNVKIVLVDEYQDTNYIQEKIYFKIAEAAIANGGGMTVVGDDDQSLYRFRGATVDLFTNYKQRAEKQLKIEVQEINLKTNYRSTENIINHCNNFIETDKKYQDARVANKPKIVWPEIKKEKIPVLGMFRNNQEMLANDLSRFINTLIKKGEVKQKVTRIITKDYYQTLNSDIDASKKLIAKNNTLLKGEEKEYITIKLDEELGSASDIAFLTYSPKEIKMSTRLFPYLLRKNLEKKNINVFNPRGQDLQEVEEVQIFCGLMLMCIDPDGSILESDKKIPKLAKSNIFRWKIQARDYIKECPNNNFSFKLENFITKWQNREPVGYDEWPKYTSLMNLAYKLITWIKKLQDDVEGVVYLEAITKTITQTGFFNKYSSNISFESKESEKESILEAYWNIFIPLASGGVEIDEGLIDTLPSDRINFMSIHQSKGLEFPLVIVDVGSKFKKNDSRDQKLRFPKAVKTDNILEEDIRIYSSLGESERNEKDKMFDDLTRLYFVAFSRAECVLMLVGLTNCLDGYKLKDQLMQIPNIAMGWNRDEQQIGFDELYLI